MAAFLACENRGLRPFSALVSPAERRALSSTAKTRAEKGFCSRRILLIWAFIKLLKKVKDISYLPDNSTTERRKRTWKLAVRTESEKRSFFVNIFVTFFHNRKWNEINENQRVIVW